MFECRSGFAGKPFRALSFRTLPPADFGKDQVKLFGFLPERPGLSLQVGHCLRQHPEKELRFASFALADRYFVAEILLRYGIIGLTVVRAYAGARPNQLVNKATRYRAYRNPLDEINNSFPKQRRALFQIVRFVTVALAVLRALVLHSDLPRTWLLQITVELGHLAV